MANKVLRINSSALLRKIQIDLKNAFIEYNSLFDYYRETSKMIIAEKIKLENKYNYALIIAHAFDSLY